MHPASEHHIPDGLLAAGVLLSEKPRHGVASKNPALNQGINEANSTAAIGLRAGLLLNRVQSRYTGKERDAESGLDNFEARYYGSSMGRFMSPDGVFDGSSPDNPQSWNLYSYVQNNPIINTDPDGHDCVVQSRTSNTTESVTTSSGNCDNVSVGDGQTKTYVPGTVTGITANGGNSIDIGYNSYDGQSSGVTNAGAAPIPDNPNLAYNWGNNAQGYQQLGAASRLVKDATIAVGGTYAVLGAAGLATGVIGGEGASLAGVGRSGASLANRLLHIFGNPEHGLGALVAKFGGPLAAYEAMQVAAQSQVSASGPFTRVAITVGGIAIQINGTVIDGVVKISTAYIPH
jgi:RHS repeat-associated protein